MLVNRQHDVLNVSDVLASSMFLAESQSQAVLTYSAFELSCLLLQAS